MPTVTDSMRQAGESYHREQRDAAHRQRNSDLRRAARIASNASSGRTHAASFAASLKAAGVAPVPLLLTTDGRSRLGATYGWLATRMPGRKNTAVTTDGHLVDVFDDWDATVSGQPVAGQVFLVQDARGNLIVSAEPYARDRGLIARDLGRALAERNVPLIEGEVPESWTLDPVPTVTSDGAAGLRAAILGALTLAGLAIAIWVLSTRGSLAYSGIGAAAFTFVLAAACFQWYPSRRIFDRDVVRYRRRRIEHVICGTCGRENQVPTAHICSRCRRVLPEGAARLAATVMLTETSVPGRR
jgi:hypothetical protein